jgi:2-polyprenyl-3-methyl-5-hydroxy-6-metoxy-1,4-benzoquinol methylase
MNQIKVNREYYNQLYSHRSPVLHLLHARLSFDQQSKSRANHAVVDPIIKRIVREKGSIKVLDYGSGWGVFLINLSKIRADLYCFDLATNAVKSLQSTMQFLGRSVKVIDFDKNGNIHPGDFDLIICSHVLEHVESDRVLLRQLVQALRTGGYLLANVPINEVGSDPKHVRSYTPEILEELMVSMGLNVVAQWQIDRWTGYLLEREVACQSRLLMRLTLRALRGLLALLPYLLVRLGENILSGRHQPQQLIMLGTK